MCHSEVAAFDRKFAGMGASTSVSIHRNAWTNLTAEQQQQLAAYRQALLDVPEMPGWPADVVWPTPPDFV